MVKTSLKNSSNHLQKISSELCSSLKNHAETIIKDLIKNPSLKEEFKVLMPYSKQRPSNSHSAPHNILVVPVAISDDKLLSLFLGNHSRNKIKFEDQLTGYIQALEKKLDNVKVRIDLDPKLKSCPRIDDEDITNLKLSKAVDADIIEEKSPIWILHKIDDEMTKVDEVTGRKRKMPGGLTIEHHTNLIGPSVQLALLAGFIANGFTYYKILDLFCGAGTTSNAIINLHKASDRLNIACIDKKIKAATETLAGYTCQTMLFKENIMDSLDSTFLNQKFDFIIADPPHSIIYDFVSKHSGKISEKCKVFLLYFSHTETEKWNKFIIDMLSESFRVCKVTVGGEILVVCIPFKFLKTEKQKERYRTGLEKAFNEYEGHMRRIYQQNVFFEPSVPDLLKR